MSTYELGYPFSRICQQLSQFNVQKCIRLGDNKLMDKCKQFEGNLKLQAENMLSNQQNSKVGDFPCTQQRCQYYFRSSNIQMYIRNRKEQHTEMMGPTYICVPSKTFLISNICSFQLFLVSSQQAQLKFVSRTMKKEMVLLPIMEPEHYVVITLCSKRKTTSLQTEYLSAKTLSGFKL